MATYFSCLALSFFGLQWVEKKKRIKQRSSDGDNNNNSNIVFMIHQYSFNLLTYNNSLNPYNNARQYIILLLCPLHRCGN